MIKSEIRISKLEKNSKLEIQNFCKFSLLEFWSFVIVSDFVLRISNLR
jgi:hypothetical protein